jgi:glycyl-tRNA synthetase beta chain
MTTTQSLLVELFVEELPPKVLKKLGEAFATSLYALLNRQNLTDPAATISEDPSVADPPPLIAFASPRRLAVHVRRVLSQAGDERKSQKLMPASVGLTANGEPTTALLKKLESVGATAADVPHLRRQIDGKAEMLYFDSTVTGATLADGLQEALNEALAELPIPKVMQYQLADGWTSVNFVRPAHGLVALHGDDVVPVRALGLEAGRSTHGHRFEAAIDPIELKDADHYARQLEAQGAVIASFEARRDEIARQLKAAGTKLGLTPIDDAALLDEVTALVERPNVLVCAFESEFLDVPSECLILTMKANQKYFPLLDAAGKLTNRFLVVSNIRPANPSRVIEGNERVVRPRLADAKFFFDQDRKRTLESRVAGLDKVVYHGKLGTQDERTERVRAIARAIGHQLGGDALAAQADRAAMLAKADLLTDMVGEFPELQGTMGFYYARHDGESADVAIAIEDHYKPRFAGDELPRNPVGVVVALADKLETLVGLFGVGQVPTGDKDPYALRRHALGVVRLLIEKALPLGLSELLKSAQSAGKQSSSRRVLARATDADLDMGDVHARGEDMPPDDDSVALVSDFIYERLAGSVRDQGFTTNEIEAVLALRPDRLVEIRRRLEALRVFAALAEASSLASANKRVANILRKSESDVAPEFDVKLGTQPAELELYRKLLGIDSESKKAFDQGRYAESLRMLVGLKGPVDSFFDTVMVNSEDPALRANRLGLLAQLYAAMNRVADLSKLAT